MKSMAQPYKTKVLKEVVEFDVDGIEGIVTILSRDEQRCAIMSVFAMKSR